MINKKSKIFLTGHKGLVGSAILKNLIKDGYKNIITVDKKKLDLRNQNKVFKFLKNNKFDGVINAAAKVGGIQANNIFIFSCWPFLKMHTSNSANLICL